MVDEAGRPPLSRSHSIARVGSFGDSEGADPLRRSDPSGGDEQVVDTALAIGGEERIFDPLATGDLAERFDSDSFRRRASDGEGG